MKRATPTETGQVGRAVPRLESWLKVTGRAEYVHNLRLPGMLYGKIFRSSVSHARIKSIDVSAAQAVAGVYRVVTSKEIREVIPDPYFGPAFHDQPILAIDKVRYVGEAVAVVLAADPHVAEEAAHLISAEYEPLPAVYDEVEAMTSKAVVHDELRASRHLPGPEAPQGQEEHQHCARLPPAARRRGRGPQVCAQGVRAPLPHAAGDAHAARAAGLGGGVHRGQPDAAHRVAKPFVRAHRNRAPARLAGEQGAGAGAVPWRRLWREALYQAGSSRRRAYPPDEKTGEGVAHDGGAVLHHHEARHAPSASRAA